MHSLWPCFCFSLSLCFSVDCIVFLSPFYSFDLSFCTQILSIWWSLSSLSNCACAFIPSLFFNSTIFITLFYIRPLIPNSSTDNRNDDLYNRFKAWRLMGIRIKYTFKLQMLCIVCASSQMWQSVANAKQSLPKTISIICKMEIQNHCQSQMADATWIDLNIFVVQLSFDMHFTIRQNGLQIPLWPPFHRNRKQ